jgi:hypothetical protein
MPYQDETSTAAIAHDGTTQTVTVTFGGKKHVVPGRYRTLAAGMKAGEDFCRRRGWPLK